MIDTTTSPACLCHACINKHGITGPLGLPLYCERMIVCRTCGSKRCPHAENHYFPCDGSGFRELESE